MKFMYSISKKIELKQLDSLFAAIGWRRRGARKWKEVLSKSSFVFSAWDYTETQRRMTTLSSAGLRPSPLLIGFGRIMEDGAMCMFYDIGVHPKYQRKGVGTVIMKQLIKHVKDKRYASIGLFSWDKNLKDIPFYEKFEFRHVDTGMELVRYMRRE